MASLKVMLCGVSIIYSHSPDGVELLFGYYGLEGSADRPPMHSMEYKPTGFSA